MIITITNIITTTIIIIIVIIYVTITITSTTIMSSIITSVRASMHKFQTRRSAAQESVDSASRRNQAFSRN